MMFLRDPVHWQEWIWLEFLRFGHSFLMFFLFWKHWNVLHFLLQDNSACACLCAQHDFGGTENVLFYEYLATYERKSAVPFFLLFNQCFFLNKCIMKVIAPPPGWSHKNKSTWTLGSVRKRVLSILSCITVRFELFVCFLSFPGILGIKRRLCLQKAPQAPKVCYREQRPLPVWLQPPAASACHLNKSIRPLVSLLTACWS